MRTRLVLLTTMALVVLVGGMLVAAAAGGPPRTETAPLTWHAQAAEEGEVEGAQARLRATNAGASITVQTRGLEPGHAYTLWLVLVDNPEACENEPCAPPEILTDADVGGQVLYGDGNVVGNSGRATFSAHVNAGSVNGWLANRQLTPPRTAQYHAVINDHGDQAVRAHARHDAHLPGRLQRRQPLPRHLPRVRARRRRTRTQQLPALPAGDLPAIRGRRTLGERPTAHARRLR